MTLPESVIDIVQQMTDRYPSNIEKGVTMSLRRIKKLPEYEAICEELITEAVRGRLHDARHKNNEGIRREAYGDVRPKVLVGRDSDVNALELRSYFNYAIAGKALGDLTREELQTTAETEARIASGHLFNVRLCNALEPRVSKGKTVRQSIKETELQQVFQAVAKQGRGYEEAGC